MRISWCGRPPPWHDWAVRIRMRYFAVVCASLLATSAVADDKPGAEPPPSSHESVQPREHGEAGAATKGKANEKGNARESARGKARGEAQPAPASSEAAPKPCEPVKPCPID